MPVGTFKCEACDKTFQRQQGLDLHKRRWCKGENQSTEYPGVTEPEPVHIEVVEPEVGEFKVGDMVQHRHMGWKFEVAAVKDGMVGQAVQKRALEHPDFDRRYKWFRTQELMHYVRKV